MENIAAKVAAGKTLTSSEREFFMSQQPAVKDDGKITTKIMLANALGVSRAMPCTNGGRLGRMHQPRRVNGGYDLEAWREFAKRNDLKDFADQDEEGQTLAERKRYYETLILKAKYQTLIGELIPVPHRREADHRQGHRDQEGDHQLGSDRRREGQGALRIA